jgi:hypothetical protein
LSRLDFLADNQDQFWKLHRLLPALRLLFFGNPGRLFIHLHRCPNSACCFADDKIAFQFLGAPSKFTIDNNPARVKKNSLKIWGF